MRVCIVRAQVRNVVNARVGMWMCVCKSRSDSLSHGQIIARFCQWQGPLSVPGAHPYPLMLHISVLNDTVCHSRTYVDKARRLC